METSYTVLIQMFLIVHARGSPAAIIPKGEKYVIGASAKRQEIRLY